MQDCAQWHGWLWPKPRLKWAAPNRWQGRIGLNCTLTKGVRVNAKGWHSEVDVAHRCFSEGGDSISKHLPLGALASEAAGLLTNSLASWLSKSHDQPGCARTLCAHAQGVMVINCLDAYSGSEVNCLDADLANMGYRSERAKRSWLLVL